MLQTETDAPSHTLLVDGSVWCGIVAMSLSSHATALGGEGALLLGHRVSASATRATHLAPAKRDGIALSSGCASSSLLAACPTAASAPEPSRCVVGFVRTVSALAAPIPDNSDLQLALALQQRLHTNGTHPTVIGLLVSTATANRASRFFEQVADPGSVSAPCVAPVHAARAFRTRSLVDTATHRDEDGSAVVHVEAEEVFVAQIEAVGAPPSAVRSTHARLINTLDESLATFNALHRKATTHQGCRILHSAFVSYLDRIPHPHDPQLLRTLSFTKSNLDRAISQLKESLAKESGLDASTFQAALRKCITARLPQARASRETATTHSLLDLSHSLLFAAAQSHAPTPTSTNAPAASNPFATAGIPGIINASPFHVHLPHLHGNTAQQQQQVQQGKGKGPAVSPPPPPVVVRSQIGSAMGSSLPGGGILAGEEDGGFMGAEGDLIQHTTDVGAAIGGVLKRARKTRKDKGGKRAKGDGGVVSVATGAPSTFGTVGTMGPM
ncbi:hypothetical protein BC830DRAFT_1175043, partial [Chytriomyces sp. MP71]